MLKALVTLSITLFCM